MFMRFVITQIDEDSRQPQGVFTAAYSLLDSGELSSEEWNQLREVMIWFNKNLSLLTTALIKSGQHSGLSRVLMSASSRCGKWFISYAYMAILSKFRNAGSLAT
jgi:hypothetical protein